MNRLKQIVKRIPGVPGVHRRARSGIEALRNWGKSSEEIIFSRYFSTNVWGGQSRSGRGSDLAQTRVLVRELPRLLEDLGVRSLLDIPCGDFHWMQHVDLGTAHYIGADIVKPMVRSLRRYANERREFRVLDLMMDDLPRVDLVFVRDCLVHLPYAAIWRAIANVRRSGATWMLTTTFPDHGPNHDIAMGDWRPLNLELDPFRLPRPRHVILEECSENDGIYADKSMALWEVSTLDSVLLNRTTGS